MQLNTFDGTVDGIEAVFQFHRLKFRQTEKVLSLIEGFRSGTDPKPLAAIREAIGICVSGWSRSEPIEDWDLVLDLQQAVKVLNVALRGNNPSEADAKKSELPHS